MLILLQLAAYIWFALEIPLQYDEWHSWHFFSDVSFYTIFTWYPAPNNHVFYNLLARCFVLTGVDAEFAVRVPSIIAALLTSYYFFKFLCRYLPSCLGLVLVSLVVSEFYFVWYNSSARGYSFVYLFCTLLLYAAGPLSEKYEGRYRVLLILTQVLGLFSVLSFMYVMVVPGFFLFIYVIRQKSMAALMRLIGDYTLVLLLTIACYSGILFIGDPTVFFNPEAWTEKFNIHDPEWFSNLIMYLDAKFVELFGFYRLKTTAVVVILLVLYHIWRKDTRRLFMVFVCASMFFFPFFIVLVHRVYPFGRSLNFLILPSIFLLGIAINDILELVRRLLKVQFANWITTIIVLLSVLFCLGMYIHYPSRHRSGWDYEMDLMRRTRMKDIIPKIDAIGRTNRGFEFFPNDVLIHFVYKERPEVPVTQSILDTIKNEDVVFIHHSELDRLRPQLKNYSFLFDYGDITVFVSDSL